MPKTPERLLASPGEDQKVARSPQRSGMSGQRYTGYVIPPYYDSLISKLVAHGKDRKEAIARMERALYKSTSLSA